MNVVLFNEDAYFFGLLGGFLFSVRLLESGTMGKSRTDG